MGEPDLKPPFLRKYSIEELAAQVTKPVRVVDLCCGPGGVGYALQRLLSSFDIRFVGVDIEDYSDRYPGDFVQADVKDLTLSDLGRDRRVDLVWCSPPCQAYSKLSHIWYDNPEEVHPTLPELNIRDVCKRLGRSYIIENVVGCYHLRNPIALNGTAFGLPLNFERWFETSFPVPEKTAEPGDDIIQVENAGTKELARAKGVPPFWGKTEVRSAIPAEYVAYLLAFCPTLPEITPPGGIDGLIQARTPAEQQTLTQCLNS